MSGDMARRLDSLLDELREAVLTGDLLRLGPIETALRDCETNLVAEPATLQALRDKAERNRTLLLAAGRGVRLAQRRLTEIAQTLSGLAFYDAQGCLHRRSPPPQKLARRL